MALFKSKDDKSSDEHVETVATYLESRLDNIEEQIVENQIQTEKLETDKTSRDLIEEYINSSNEKIIDGKNLFRYVNKWKNIKYNTLQNYLATMKNIESIGNRKYQIIHILCYPDFYTKFCL